MQGDRSSIEPDARDRAAYEQLYALYRKLYFAFGMPGSEAVGIGDVLPGLRRLAAQVRLEAGESACPTSAQGGQA